nr:four helix bundle suffix domain-containing protein [Prevotella sp. CAG:255]
MVYQKAECIYYITFYFAHKYLDKADRTINQMIQAARSGKQNIAEGSAASNTWRETELKLTNAAKASLQEFLIDYEEYLRVRNLEQWSVNSIKAMQTRMACKNHTDSAYFRKAITVRPDETIANIAITLIHQTDSLPRKLIDHLKTEFLTHGGIKEEMYAARKEWSRQNQ